MHINIEDIKISNKEIVLLNKKPFPYFCWDNFLPEKIYNELDNSWPSDDYYDVPIYGGKQGFKKRETKKFFQEYPNWKKLIDLIETQEFISDIQKFVKPLQFPYRPFTSLRKWNLKKHQNSLMEKILTSEVHIDWELSIYRENDFLAPHTDRITKYISLLLYFPDPNWKNEYGGGTIMYEPKNRKLNKNWSNNYVSLEHMNKINNFSYNRNRMVGFIKTANSWHGVEPIQQPKGMKRKALAINIGIPENKHLNFTNRIIESFYRRKEAHFFNGINLRSIQDKYMNQEISRKKND